MPDIETFTAEELKRFDILYVDKVVESSSDEDNDGYLSEVF